MCLCCIGSPCSRKNLSVSTKWLCPWIAVLACYGSAWAPSPPGRLMLSSLSSSVRSPVFSQPSQGAVGRVAGCGPSQPGRRGMLVPKGSCCDDHFPQREPFGAVCPRGCSLRAARSLPVGCLPCRRARCLLSVTHGAVQAAWCEAGGRKKKKKRAFWGLPVSRQLNQGRVSQGGSDRPCPACEGSCNLALLCLF